MNQRQGVSLGIDVGRVRVGVAASDPDGIMAQPVQTLTRDLKGKKDLHELVEMVRERQARRVFIGLPLTLKAQDSSSTQDARSYAGQLLRLLSQSGEEVEVCLLDERLSTVSAHQQLHAAGVSSRKHRKMIDQVAAVGILEQALESLRRSGAAGEPVSIDLKRRPQDG